MFRAFFGFRVQVSPNQSRIFALPRLRPSPNSTPRLCVSCGSERPNPRQVGQHRRGHGHPGNGGRKRCVRITAERCAGGVLWSRFSDFGVVIGLRAQGPDHGTGTGTVIVALHSQLHMPLVPWSCAQGYGSHRRQLLHPAARSGEGSLNPSESRKCAHPQAPTSKLPTSHVAWSCLSLFPKARSFPPSRKGARSIPASRSSWLDAARRAW